MSSSCNLDFLLNLSARFFFLTGHSSSQSNVWYAASQTNLPLYNGFRTFVRRKTQEIKILCAFGVATHGPVHVKKSNTTHEPKNSFVRAVRATGDLTVGSTGGVAYKEEATIRCWTGQCWVQVLKLARLRFAVGATYEQAIVPIKCLPKSDQRMTICPAKVRYVMGYMTLLDLPIERSLKIIPSSYLGAFSRCSHIRLLKSSSFWLNPLLWVSIHERTQSSGVLGPLPNTSVRVLEHIQRSSVQNTRPKDQKFRLSDQYEDRGIRRVDIVALSGRRLNRQHAGETPANVVTAY